jgi:alanine dehydrogenase
MQPGAVIVDLSILDGGAFETTPLTDLATPCQDIDGIVHVGIVNLAGAVPRTSSHALAQAALPHVLRALATP